MKKHQKVVIIGHGYTSRLSVIRSVAQIGCDVTVIVITGYKRDGKTLNTKRPIDCYSKYVSQVYYSAYRDERGLIRLLLEKCTKSKQKVVIIPDSDFSAVVIDKNQELLKEQFLFPHIHHTPGAVLEWMGKVKQKGLASEVGLNVALSSIISINDKHYDIPESINYPCFTKPLATIVGGKQILKKCCNKDELRCVLDKAGSIADMQVLIEDFKPIEKEYAVVGFSDGHNVVIPGVVQILDLAHGSHFGVACRGKVVPVDGFENLIDKFKQFILKIGFMGVFDIDFYQSDGDFYFCELNLRIGGSLYAFTKMGVNLPSMMVKSLIGESITDMKKMITSSATYVNERMCLDDWYYHYISTKEYHKMVKSADISFVKDEDDVYPNIMYKKEYRNRQFKRIIKRILFR